MSTESNSQFDVTTPVKVYVESGKGTVTVHAAEIEQTRVDITGPDADEVDVHLQGDHLSVIAPKSRGGFLGGDRRLDITVTVASGSELATKLGSADLTTTGSLGASQLRSGSGEVAVEHLVGPAVLETGSGTISVDHAEQPLRIKSGSGDVTIQHSEDDVTVSTGSGDVEIADCAGATAVKTGSGDLTIGQASRQVTMSTGSGDLVVRSIASGTVQMKGASGDVRVGVPAGTPVWTDITTVSGHVHSAIESAGQPEKGAPYVEVRAKTVSGDVVLTQV